jgi:metal-dependent amidase/aminoacylase/carboxypeptidase family protein
LVAKHFQSIGLEVKTGIADTGVLGISKGEKPGLVIASRADIDTLPVEEKNGLLFALWLEFPPA